MNPIFPRNPNMSIPISIGKNIIHIPILMFHHVEDIPSNTSNQLEYRLSFPVDRFEQFLKYFKSK